MAGLAGRRRRTRRVDLGGCDPELALWQIADSALPVGTFTHSFGLEDAIQAGRVRDEVDVARWFEEFLHDQVSTTDLLAIRLAGEGVPLAELDAVLTASMPARENREASRSMGARLIEIGAECFPGPPIDDYAAAVTDGRLVGHYCLAYAAICLGLHIDVPRAQRAYVSALVIGLTQNAVRAVPLGQAAGQRVITALHPAMTAAVERAAVLPPELLGAAMPALEIAQMRHETQHARMFMS